MQYRYNRQNAISVQLYCQSKGHYQRHQQ